MFRWTVSNESLVQYMVDVTVNRRGEERVRLGHLWVYRSDVLRAEAEPGAMVRVVGPRGRAIGYALYSSRSEIALRLFTRGDAPPDLETWRARIEQAVALSGSAGDRCDGVPRDPRRGRFVAFADRRPLWRLPRAADAVAGYRPPPSRHHATAGRDPAAGRDPGSQRSQSADARGTRTAGRRRAWRGAGFDSGARWARSLWRRSL